MPSALALWEGCCKVFLILFTAGVGLEALHALGERGRHVLGQRERGWREVGKKEVRRVEETNVV